MFALFAGHFLKVGFFREPRRREWFGRRPSANALLTEALPSYILGAIKKSSEAFAMALF